MRGSAPGHGAAVALVSTVAIAAAIAATYLLMPGRSGAVAASDRAGTAVPAALDPTGGSGPVSGAETERLIRAYEGRSNSVRDAGELTFLAQLYLQRGRATGDAATYEQAHAALRRALALAPTDMAAKTLLASTQATMHDFRGALGTGHEVLAARPGDPATLAVVGDAQLETGQYDAATATYAHLGRISPATAAVLVRQARLAWLTGDLRRARELAADASAAAVAAGAFGTGLAFYPAFQGQLELEQGAYLAAADFYARALRDAPSWHVALAGLGRAKAAVGDLPAAAALLQEAADVVPQPEYLAALGDVLAADNDPRGAQQQYETVTLTARLARLNRQLYNRQLVLFDADHQRDPRSAVRLAKAEIAVRQDVYGWDALSWALLAAGETTQARAASDKALALGTPDPRLLYHAGMVAAAQSDRDRARFLLSRALTISPQFDPVQAPRARAMLGSLGDGAG
ncbi:MAG: tetratricopeptide repeat protein [Kineosporiaceae bacterium]